jgi:hypothetical protein
MVTACLVLRCAEKVKRPLILLSQNNDAIRAANASFLKTKGEMLRTHDVSPNVKVQLQRRANIVVLRADKWQDTNIDDGVIHVLGDHKFWCV